MIIDRAVVVAMALAFGGSVHAQACSGGPDGGMDAAGVQCNDSGRTQADVPARAAPTSLRASTSGRDTAVPRLQRASLRDLRAVAAPAPAHWAAVAPAVASRHAVTQSDVRHESTCSGGPDGGADATGNQCNAR